jgi:hypothetical protein
MWLRHSKSKILYISLNNSKRERSYLWGLNMQNWRERREKRNFAKDSVCLMIFLKFLKLLRMPLCHCKITWMLRWLRSVIYSRNQRSCLYLWTQYLGSSIISLSNTHNLDLRSLLSQLQMRMSTNFTQINQNLTRKLCTTPAIVT